MSSATRYHAGATSYWDEVYRTQYERGELERRDVRADTRWLDEFLPRLRRVAVARALDLGCGTGQEVRRMVMEGFRAVGLDAAEAGLQIGHRLCAEASFVRGGISRGLPFRDEAFGVVLSRFVFHRFSEAITQQLIAEVSRILVRGGYFLFLVNATRHRQERLQYPYERATLVEPDLLSFPDGQTFRFFSEASLAKFFAGWRLDVQRQVDFDQYGVRKLAWLVLARNDRAAL